LHRSYDHDHDGPDIFMCEQEKDFRYYFCISNNEYRMLSDHDIVLKVEKDTMGQKKLVDDFF
jgi:hypothetical protein